MLGFPGLSWNHISPLPQLHTSEAHGFFFWYPLLSLSGQEVKAGSSFLGWLLGVLLMVV